MGLNEDYIQFRESLRKEIEFKKQLEEWTRKNKDVQIQKKKKKKKIINLEGLTKEVLRVKPNKFLFRRSSGTISIPKEEFEPILKRRSRYFSDEYEKEKAILGWK